MKSQILKNTATNYITVFIRVAQALLVTRWTIAYLGQEYYGLWALLWSFFSYALLLDFSFGITAQKYTAEEIYKKDLSHYNKIISAVFSFHIAMGFVIALCTIAASFFLGDIIRVHDPEKLSYCTKAFLIFGLGTAVVFPFGMFSEILVGLQKLYLRNYINIGLRLTELVCVLIIFLLGGRLISLVIFTMISALVSNLIMGVMVLRSIKGIKISFGLELKICKEIAGFSGYTYLMSLSRLIMGKSNRLLISIFCGLESVGGYHIASRIPDFCYMGATQYQENVSPISANLNATGQFKKLTQIIFNSLRWNVFISTIVILPCFLYAGELIQILFNVSDNNITYISRLFYISMFTSVACRNIPESFLLMSGHHKLTGITNTLEAVGNLGFNIALLPIFGAEIVLINSIVLRLIFTFAVFVPKMLGQLKIETLRYLWNIYILPFFIFLPAFVISEISSKIEQNIGVFASTSLGITSFCATFSILSYFFLINGVERKSAREKISNKFVKILYPNNK